MTPKDDSGKLSRRELLIRSAGIAGTAGAAALLGQSTIARAATKRALPALPPPAQSGIDHIVVVMMENRSFDHFLGWVPKANGKQAGLQYVDNDGITHSTAHLTEFQGCGHPDPDHSYEGGRIQFADGACDGFLKGNNDDFSIGYYEAADLPFYGHAAPYWTTCDRYFAAIMAATYPNRFYQHSAQTDRLHNGDLGLTTLPTIWDRLAEAKISRRYYYSDVPFIALWGDKYLKMAHPFDDFVADCASGHLPKVSFLDPRFLGEDEGVAGDDHPHSDIRVGQDFSIRSTRRSRAARRGRTRCSSSTTTSGAVSSTTCRRRWRATPTPRRGCVASAFPRSLSRRTRAGITLRIMSTTTLRCSR
jgi:phospholipase C